MPTANLGGRGELPDRHVNNGQELNRPEATASEKPRGADTEKKKGVQGGIQERGGSEKKNANKVGIATVEPDGRPRAHDFGGTCSPYKIVDRQGTGNESNNLLEGWYLTGQKVRSWWLRQVCWGEGVELEKGGGYETLKTGENRAATSTEGKVMLGQNLGGQLGPHHRSWK